MKKESLFNLLFMALIILAFYLFYRILAPFLSILAWAAILTIIFYPFFSFINRFYQDRRGWAAVTTTLVVIIAIVIPSGLLFNLFARELLRIYQYLEQFIAAGKHLTLYEQLRHIKLLKGIGELLDQYFDLSRTDLNTILLDHLKKLNMYVVGEAPKFIKGISTAIVKFSLIAVTLFFFFKDGREAAAKIKALIPLSAEEREHVLKKIVEMIQATIYGGIIVALVQGGFGALGFFIVGISSPLFWGTIMALLSFMHIVGPFMVWVPAVFVLLFEGAYLKALILTIWGSTLVSLSDNFLRPIIISGRTQVHPLLVFFSTLGGLALFGLVGFIAGPLVITVCLAIIDIYTAPAVPRRNRAGKKKPSRGI
jgi:predicted PurR-regulated permease PerM